MGESRGRSPRVWGLEQPARTRACVSVCACVRLEAAGAHTCVCVCVFTYRTRGVGKQWRAAGNGASRPPSHPPPPGTICFCREMGMKRFSFHMQRREVGGGKKARVGGERGVKLEQPEQRTNRVQRPAGPLGNKPGRVREAAWPAPAPNRSRTGADLRCGAGTGAPSRALAGRPGFSLGNPRTGRTSEKNPVPPSSK